MTGEKKPLRVLILEDRLPDAELLLIHLRRAGYELDAQRVDSAAGLRAALPAGTWDVVLSDYSMPQFTAPDALAIIKDLHLDVPFIIISGSVGEAAAVEAMKAGAHDFFLKDGLARLASAIERERGEARVRAEHRQAIRELHESEERLRDAVRARDDFLSIASHELKTPLTSLSLQVESARELASGRDDPSARLERLDGKLQSASRQVARLTTLINSLLDVTRITAGRMGLAREAFDLREAVETVLSGASELLLRAGCTVATKATGPVIGDWDRLRVESVIFNLVSNSLKYAAGKPIEIAVDTEDGHGRLVVTDHGIGIPTDAQERIFRRFERAVPDRHFGGFGLGLWVVRDIVDAHGGTITVSSTPGAGSTFTVMLPLQAPKEEG